MELGLILLVVFGGGAVVAAGVAGAILLARSGRDKYEAQGRIPGQNHEVPTSWAGDHTPEARMHRRLVALVTSLQESADNYETVDTLDARIDVEQAALALDRELVAAHGLPEPQRGEMIARFEDRVANLERSGAAVIISANRLDQSSPIGHTDISQSEHADDTPRPTPGT